MFTIRGVLQEICNRTCTIGGVLWDICNIGGVLQEICDRKCSTVSALQEVRCRKCAAEQKHRFSKEDPGHLGRQTLTNETS